MRRKLVCVLMAAVLLSGSIQTDGFASSGTGNTKQEIQAEEQQKPEKEVSSESADPAEIEKPATPEEAKKEKEAAKPAEDEEVTKPATPTEDKEVTKPETPAEDKEVTKPETPAEDKEVTKPETPAEDKEAVKKQEIITYTTVELEERIRSLYQEQDLAGESLYASKILLVESSSEDFGVAAEASGAIETMRCNGIYVLRFETIEQAALAYEYLSGLETTVWVQANNVLEVSEKTAEPKTTKDQLQKSELLTYLEARESKKEVSVAILDTGYATGTHDRVSDAGFNSSSSGQNGISTDGHGHGTDIGNIVLAHTPESVSILPLKVADDQGRATVLSVWLGIQKAIACKADVILLTMNTKQPHPAPLLTRAIQEEAVQNVLVVAAAGDGGTEVKDTVPGNLEEVITVSAVDRTGSAAAYANSGNAVDYWSYGAYGEKTGTAYAAATVSAAIAYSKAVGESYENLFSVYGNGFVSLENPVDSKAKEETKGKEEKAQEEKEPAKQKAAGEKKEKEKQEKTEEAAQKTDYRKVIANEKTSTLKGAKAAIYYTFYVKTDGYYNVTLRKGTVKEKYKISVKIKGEYDPSMSMYRYPGSQKISYVITDADGKGDFNTDFEPTLVKGTYTTKRDKVEPQQPADQRQYLFPILLDFKSFDGYTIAYDPATTTTYEVYNVGFTKHGFGGDFDTNGMGITNFHRNDGKFDHHNVAIIYKENAGTIKFSKNGSDVTLKKDKKAPANKSLSYTDPTISLPNPGDIWSKTGYHIQSGTKAWHVGSATEETYAEQADGSKNAASTLKTALNLKDKGGTSTTLYANWAANTYKVTADLNGGKGTFADLPATYDVEKKLWAAKPTRTGYTFTGWKCGKVTYDSSEKFSNLTATNNGTVTMTAQWTPITYTVQADLNGGTGTFAELKATYDVEGTLWATKPTRTGYTFTEWKRGEKTYAASGKFSNLTTTNGATVTMTATWKINTSTLKVNPDGGTWGGSAKEQSFVQDYKTTKAIPVPTKTGYLFAGWIKTGTYGTLSSATAAATYTYGATNAAMDIIKAKWQAIQYKVKYHANGVDVKGSMADSKFLYAGIYNLTPNAYTREHYDFVGWKDDKGNTYSDGASVTKLASTQDAVVNLYAQWEEKIFNVGYSGAGQSYGTNMLEYNIFQGNNYIFRPSVFHKTQLETRETKDGQVYTVEQMYSFEKWRLNGWNENFIKTYSANEFYDAEKLYQDATGAGGISSNVTDSNPYDEVLPLTGMSLKEKAPAKEYVNLQAVWNAYPIICVEPKPDIDEYGGGPRIEDGILFFYEGEEPTKADLLAHLTVTDKEDGNLIDNVKIIKIKYSNGKRKVGYTKQWEKDDYIFDTYYRSMEKDEVVTHIVTYEVTDSVGNTTTVELPVKVKYNHFPEIQTKDDTFYYYKDEADQSLITAEELIGRAVAVDKEDGDMIKDKITLENFDPDELLIQTSSITNFSVLFKLTDRFKKTTYRRITVQVVDPVALDAEKLRYYTRFISLKYMDTLEPTSTWREPKKWAYLKWVLENETPIETWYFTHEEVVKVKKWAYEDGSGHWKIGQEANREFLKLFGHCRTVHSPPKDIDNYLD